MAKVALNGTLTGASPNESTGEVFRPALVMAIQSAPKEPHPETDPGKEGSSQAQGRPCEAHRARVFGHDSNSEKSLPPGLPSGAHQVKVVCGVEREEGGNPGNNSQPQESQGLQESLRAGKGLPRCIQPPKETHSQDQGTSTQDEVIGDIGEQTAHHACLSPGVLPERCTPLTLPLP